jgi:sRNA-binding protein
VRPPNPIAQQQRAMRDRMAAYCHRNPNMQWQELFDSCPEAKDLYVNMNSFRRAMNEYGVSRRHLTGNKTGRSRRDGYGNGLATESNLIKFARQVCQKREGMGVVSFDSDEQREQWIRDYADGTID